MYAVNEAQGCAPDMPASQEFGKIRRGNDQSHRSHQESGAHCLGNNLESQKKTRSPKFQKSIGATVVVIIFAICLAGCIWTGLYQKTSALLSSHQHYPARLLASLEVEEPCDVDPAEVIGLEYCPELEQMVPTFMEIKKSLLRLSIDAASDAGESPMMLISILIKESADLLFSSAYLSEESGKVDGWLAEQDLARQKTESENLLYNTSTEFVPELFIDRIDEFYVEDLGRSRPVVVYVSGRDLCAFLDEFTSHEGESPTSAEHPGLQVTPESEVDVVGKTPLVLLTLGWDGSGSPFYHHGWECSLDVLDLPQVMLWIVSHGEGYPPSPKVKFVPIGFGGTSSKSGLPQSQVVGYLKEKLHRLESNPCLSGQKMEMLFMCNNNSSNTPRPAINDALENFDSSDEPPRVVPNNHFPLDPADTAVSSTNGIFAVSPPGTRPDCFRHYELLLSGNIVYVPDDPSLRLILSGLPVVFVEGIEGAAGGWGNITCDAMAEHARHVHQRLQDGMRQETVPAFNYAKLMLPYWSRFVRDVVWEAGEQLRQSHNGILREGYLSPNDYPAEMIVGP